VTAIRPEGDLFRVDIVAHDAEGAVMRDHVYARHIVLATGLEGNGDWEVPAFIREALPRSRFAHAGEPIDFHALEGKRVAVLGAGASAFDNASTALESGAAQAILCIRRKELQRVNPQLWMGKAGFLRHYADLSDAWKWRFMRHLFDYNLPAPQDAYNRFSRLPGASIRQNSGWESVRLRDGPDGPIEIRAASGIILADFLIVAVGFTIDFHLRPELSAFASEVALWQDRFVAPPEEAQSVVATYPYLGSTFELTEKVAGSAPYLAKIRNFTYGTIASMGLSGSAISGLKYSVPRLVHGITRSLFVEDVALQYRSFADYAEPELVGPVPF
jgi:cation diffusion facilitator CzcD-associated flavoprotein CzcO